MGVFSNALWIKKNGAQMFQKRIFCQLDFAFAYLDDIVIASSSNDEYFGHLRQVFDVLSTNSLVITNPNAFLELPSSTI